MIAGLGAAFGLVTQNLDTYSRHMRTVRDFLVDQLIRNFSLVTADETNTRLGLGEVQTGTEHNPHLHRELDKLRTDNKMMWVINNTFSF